MEPELETVEQRLRRSLYRFDCPAPLTLGEYVLDLVPRPARVHVAGHTLGCGLCSQELTETRTFLATEIVPNAPGVWGGLRRVVASLLNPPAQSHYAIARGSQSGEPSEYRAGPITIVIGDVRGKRRGSVSVDGLILHSLAPPSTLAGCGVMLSNAARTQVHLARTDELGSFGFEDVSPGIYTLEVTLVQEVVVVQDVHVGS